MATPQLNLRMPAEHHDLMKLIAARLREDPGLAPGFRAVCNATAWIGSRNGEIRSVPPPRIDTPVPIDSGADEAKLLWDAIRRLSAEVSGLAMEVERLKPAPKGRAKRR